MKGMTTQVMVVIYALAIMVILLIISVGFVSNYTNIPFEKLWELTPGSGTVTQGSIIQGNLGGPIDINTATHIFTAQSQPNDLSEIACLIGSTIFNDFSKNGVEGTRSVVGGGAPQDGMPFTQQSNGAHGYLIDAKSFIYENLTNTTVNDNVFAAANSDYANCHICRNNSGVARSDEELPSGTINDKSTWKNGITNLDEVCINMQLRDKANGGDYLCHGGTLPYMDQNYVASDGYFHASSGKLEQFGNNKCMSPDNNILNDPNWKNFCDGGSQDDDDFCDNWGKDMITWSAYKYDNSYSLWHDSAGNPYYYLAKDSELGNWGSNNNELTVGFRYMYGVWWNSNDKTYWVSFVIIPKEYKGAGITDFSLAWKLYSQAGNIFDRWNALGFFYPGPREVGDFDVNLAAGISMSDLQKYLADQAFGDGSAGSGSNHIDKVTCSTCKSLEDSSCYGSTTTITCDDSSGGGGNTCFRGEPIKIKTNATDCSGTFQPGKYRVIANNWWERKLKCYGPLCPCPAPLCNWFNTLQAYDRTLTIVQIS